MGDKNLSTLVTDVYELFSKEGHKVSDENLNIFCDNLKTLLKERLEKPEREARPIRFSSLGKPDRQVWYEAKLPEKKEGLLEKTHLKFLYGDIVEQMILFLVREAGHEVKDEQKQVSINGITGSIDAIVDGTVVDVKSASPFGFQKLKQLKVLEDDPFGYVKQLSGYAEVLTPGKPAGWIAFDKVSGELAVPILSSSIIASHPPEERINHLKEVIERDEPPARCYPDEPDGAKGNRKLSTGCSYCPFKKECWPNLRAFAYSTGPKFLTVVKELPRVVEIET